jgi:hypothetical protein
VYEYIPTGRWNVGGPQTRRKTQRGWLLPLAYGTNGISCIPLVPYAFYAFCYTSPCSDTGNTISSRNRKQRKSETSWCTLALRHLLTSITLHIITGVLELNEKRLRRQDWHNVQAVIRGASCRVKPAVKLTERLGVTPALLWDPQVSHVVIRHSGFVCFLVNSF